MIGLATRNILRMIFLLLFQGLILNELNFGTYFVPYLYLLFILALPIDIPNWVIIPLAFIYGISMDAFTNTLGLHASACVFSAYTRPRVLRILAPREGYDIIHHPHLMVMGFNWFFYYAGIMILLHHTFFFFAEIFTLVDFFKTFLRILCSSVFTLTLVILSQLVTGRPSQR